METQLAAIGEALRQRELLERSLEKALTEQSALRDDLNRIRAKADARFEQLLEERAAERRDFEDRIREADETTRLASDRAELANSATSEREHELAEFRREADRTKRKYRASQALLAREKSRVDELERQLAAALKDLEIARGRLGWRVQARIEGWSRQLWTAIRLRRVERRKGRAELDLVRSSDLFDAAWYLAQYPDIAQSGVDPAEHFVSLGWREGRSPSAAFSVTRYLKRHADVAAQGVNPLVHYLEHGRFEGREFQPSGAAPVAPTSFSHSGPAAPWVRFELPPERFADWSRACSIAPEDPRAILVDDLAIGFAGNSRARSRIEQALADLRELSVGAGDRIASSPIHMPGVPGLADAWFTTRNRLSTRWQVQEPIVIRAVQCDIARGGQLFLVGEGIAAGPLDVVDFDMANPMFPLLVIAAASSGDIVGTSTIAFPSIFRGGAHYPELIDLAGLDCPSPLQVSQQLESNLRQIRSGKAQPLINSISVDLRSADGTGPLFQSGVRAWLSEVMGVGITPASDTTPDSGAAAHLAEAISKDPAYRRHSGGMLKLAADMAPAISVLVAHARKGSTSRECAMAVIVAEKDHSQPSTRFEPPATKAFFGNIQSSYYPQAFPRMKGRDARPALAAIRTVQNPLKESELLRPDTSLSVDASDSGDLATWIVSIKGADDEFARDSLTALALQNGAGRFRIALVGPGAEAILPTARSLFEDRATVADNLEASLISLDTALVGYMGSGIILHDARTFMILSALLEDYSNTSASCVLINAEQRGRSWVVSPVDAGLIPVDRTVVRGAATAHESLMLWRTTFPVIEPPNQLWLARRESVRGWHAGEAAAKEIHLVTTLISASASRLNEHEVPFLAPCPSGQSWATRAKVLVG